jgi:hypothetical protein
MIALAGVAKVSGNLEFESKNRSFSVYGSFIVSSEATRTP